MDDQDKIENTKEGIGGLVGIVIIILVLLAGAFYFYNQRLTMRKANTASSATATDPFLQSVLNDLNSASSTDIQGNLNSINNALSK